MKKFKVDCKCGFGLSTEAETKEEAIAKMQEMMDEKGIYVHWAERHINDTTPKPTLEQAHANIAKNIVEDTGQTEPKLAPM